MPVLRAELLSQVPGSMDAAFKLGTWAGAGGDLKCRLETGAEDESGTVSDRNEDHLSETGGKAINSVIKWQRTWVKNHSRLPRKVE